MADETKPRRKKMPYRRTMAWIYANSDMSWLDADEPVMSQEAILAARIFGRKDEEVVNTLLAIHEAAGGGDEDEGDDDGKEDAVDVISEVKGKYTAKEPEATAPTPAETTAAVAEELTA